MEENRTHGAELLSVLFIKKKRNTNKSNNYIGLRQHIGQCCFLVLIVTNKMYIGPPVSEESKE